MHKSKYESEDGISYYINDKLPTEDEISQPNILITILCSFTTVKSGEIGLKVRFGKIVDSSLKEGLNIKIPYISI